MNGIQEIFFYHAPANKNVNITIKDELSPAEVLTEVD